MKWLEKFKEWEVNDDTIVAELPKWTTQTKNNVVSDIVIHNRDYNLGWDIQITSLALSTSL